MDFMNSSKANHSPDGPVDDLDRWSSFQTEWMVAAFIYIVVFVVGVLGNALVLWVTVSEARRSVNAIRFLNLAVADLLSCLVLPIHIITTLKHGSWLFGHSACSSLMALFKFSFYASVLLLVTISADRVLLVFKPNWCKKFRVVWWAWQASVMTWILALVLSIPYFVFGVYAEAAPSKRRVCGVTLELGSSHGALTMTRFVLSFLVPLVTMSVCYVFLLRTCCRKATRSTKTLKMVVAMVTSFFVFWLPCQLSFMLLTFYLTPSFNNWQASLHIIGTALASVNCCINPIIYVTATHIRVFKFQPDRLRQLLTEDCNSESQSHPRSTVDSDVP